jgi:hypothetical protein
MENMKGERERKTKKGEIEKDK